MKKIFSVLLLTMAVSFAFAKDILSGKTFLDESDGSKYEFHENGKLLILHEDNPWGEFKYKIDEKNKILSLKTEKMCFEAAKISLEKYAEDKNLHTLAEIQKIYDSEEFKNNFRISRFGLVEKQFLKFIDFKKPDWKDTVYNIVCFSMLIEIGEIQEDEEFNPGEDYATQLAEVLKHSDDEKADNENTIKGLAEAQYETIENQIKGVLFLYKNQDFKAYYDYEFDGEKLEVLESSKMILPARFFYFCKYEEYTEREELFNFSYLIFSIQTEEKQAFYIPKKLPKKDSGTLTFVNMQDKKDSFDVKYKIQRDEKAAYLEFISGDFSGKTFKVKPEFDSTTLILQK
ncbi:hypothetical protein [Treponema zioleckii]|uniref:hypothetical protein n=1 Tax=Treponema zioleckii TaxID=331680 RepID=UPI00168A4331|nr:hypothetical protein [Treponema zioleckii]